MVASIPIGMTRVMYSSTDIFIRLLTFRIRTHMKPAVEQNVMCHSVSVIGKGKPAKARSHLLNKMTPMDTLIHTPT